MLLVVSIFAAIQSWDSARASYVLRVDSKLVTLWRTSFFGLLKIALEHPTETLFAAGSQAANYSWKLVLIGWDGEVTPTRIQTLGLQKIAFLLTKINDALKQIRATGHYR